MCYVTHDAILTFSRWLSRSTHTTYSKVQLCRTDLNTLSYTKFLYVPRSGFEFSFNSSGCFTTNMYHHFNYKHFVLCVNICLDQC